MLLATLALAPSPVLAALQQMFSFVPGIGIVQQSPKGSLVAILPAPAKGVWRGASVEVTGLMVTPTKMLLSLSGSGLTIPKHAAFRLASGTVIAFNAHNGVAAAGTGGSRWSSLHSADGQFGALAGNARGTVVVGGSEIPVALRVTATAADAAALGPTQTHHGVSLTAVASKDGATANLTLVPTSSGPLQIFNVTPSALSIVDAAGHRYPATLIMTVGPNHQYPFPPGLGVSHYTVTIPEVGAH